LYQKLRAENNGGTVQKRVIEYDSSIDALVAIAKRLNSYENRFNMSSEDFFDQYSKGKIDDNIDFVEWPNDYQNYLGIRFDIEKKLKNGE
jgi:hypothetical protein